MLSCKVTVFYGDERLSMVVHAHSHADLYHEIAELCAAIDAESGQQIGAITLDTIISEDD